jgi:membrane protease YdiL (CAAX protease family)
MALLTISVLVAQKLPQLAAGPPAALEGPAEVGLALAITTAAALAYAGLVWLGEARLPRELSPASALIDLPFGLAIGAAIIAVVMGVLGLGGVYHIRVVPVEHVWRAIAAAIGGGFLEQLIACGVVLRLLWRAFGPAWAIALSSILFGAVHFVNPNASWISAACLTVEAGLLFSAFYILSGRLWMSMGVHAAWNYTQGWVFGAPVSGLDTFAGGPLSSTPRPGVSELLSGGAFGLEASLPALFAAGALSALLLGLAWRLGRFLPAE